MPEPTTAIKRDTPPEKKTTSSKDKGGNRGGGGSKEQKKPPFRVFDELVMPPRPNGNDS